MTDHELAPCELTGYVRMSEERSEQRARLDMERAVEMWEGASGSWVKMRLCPTPNEIVASAAEELHRIAPPPAP